MQQGRQFDSYGETWKASINRVTKKEFGMNCKVCKNIMIEFDEALIMSKYEIKYYRCPNCGLIQTEEPYWLNEAYSSAITNSDIGLLSRNINFSEIISAIIRVFFNDASTFLDYGGGYGVFARLMRDKGFDFEWYDRYCENLFVQGKEKKRDKYDVITSIELFEHVWEIEELIKEQLEWGSTLIFTTECNSYEHPLKTTDWWYYCVDHGQHVTLYTENAIKIMADKNDMHYARCGSVHVISKKRIPEWQIRVCCREARIINRLINRKSLINDDYYEAVNQIVK